MIHRRFGEHRRLSQNGHNNLGHPEELSGIEQGLLGPTKVLLEVCRLCRIRHNRHTFGTLLKANGEDVVAVVQSLMRHANVSVTMNHYVQAATPAKRRAQRGIVGLLDPNGPTRTARQLASD